MSSVGAFSRWTASHRKIGCVRRAKRRPGLPGMSAAATSAAAAPVLAPK